MRTKRWNILDHILLEPDQKIVGGHGTDSVGGFFWLGIEVADLEAWGNTQAIQLTDPFDSTEPKWPGAWARHRLTRRDRLFIFHSIGIMDIY